jgi:hypothetical protein
MAVPNRPAAGGVVESAWGTVVHDTVVAQDIQSGTFNVPTTAVAASSAKLTFPRPFAAPPAVVVVALTGGGTQLAFSQGPLAASVVLGVVNNSGANLPVGTTQVCWVAIGPRA